MSKWIAQVTVATVAPLGERDLVMLDEAVERWDATVANRAEGPGFTMIVGLDERDVITAALTAVQFSTRLGEIATGQAIGLRVWTPEQFETEALRPYFGWHDRVARRWVAIRSRLAVHDRRQAPFGAE